ncbi:MAG: PIN domain-containing protein [Candidatus Sericytochromatia bacterium]|jgi:predicted nucleic acid-binding protein|nr:PIN domain-containing protein [Candidatus Sericytochromatia bacterium]
MGRLSLPSAGEVYVDANTVIYAVEKIEPYASFLNPLWSAAGSGQLSIITSELTLLETLTKPLRDGNQALEQLFRAFLTSREVTLKPAALVTWEQAARLRALGLKTPDALHAATGLVEGCVLFLTNDRAFQRVTDLPVTVLSDAIAI